MMDEINTVTIDLDRYDKLICCSCELKQLEMDIERIRAMVFGEIAKDCRKYGERYADGTSTAIMCRHLFSRIGINDPSCNPLVQEALEGYKREKAEEKKEVKEEA